jgi:hypothetical protein
VRPQERRRLKEEAARLELRSAWEARFAVAAQQQAGLHAAVASTVDEATTLPTRTRADLLALRKHTDGLVSD